jgi:hypothetical protein
MHLGLSFSPTRGILLPLRDCASDFSTVDIKLLPAGLLTHGPLRMAIAVEVDMARKSRSLPSLNESDFQMRWQM